MDLSGRPFRHDATDFDKDEEAAGKVTHNPSKEHEQEAGQTGCPHPQPLNKDLGKDEGMDLTGRPSKHDAKELGKDEDVDLIGQPSVPHQ